MNHLDLKGRVAIVTGAARGIGYAIATRALESGAAVAMWDVDGDRLESARHQLSPHGTVSAHRADVVDERSIAAATAATISSHGHIDILVNNAGIAGGNGPTWELDPDVWRRVIDVNLVGSFLVCRAVIPRLLANGYGRVVNVASIAGKEGNPTASHYSASKAGVIALTKSLGKELATKNILVNCVTPAAANTEIFTQMKPEHIEYMRAKIPMGRFVEVEEIASLICWLASEDCAFSTGAVFDISGGRATY